MEETVQKASGEEVEIRRNEGMDTDMPWHPGREGRGRGRCVKMCVEGSRCNGSRRRRKEKVSMVEGGGGQAVWHG